MSDRRAAPTQSGRRSETIEDGWSGLEPGTTKANGPRGRVATRRCRSDGSDHGRGRQPLRRDHRESWRGATRRPSTVSRRYRVEERTRGRRPCRPKGTGRLPRHRRRDTRRPFRRPQDHLRAVDRRLGVNTPFLGATKAAVGPGDLFGGYDYHSSGSTPRRRARSDRAGATIGVAAPDCSWASWWSRSLSSVAPSPALWSRRPSEIAAGAACRQHCDKHSKTSWKSMILVIKDRTPAGSRFPALLPQFRRLVYGRRWTGTRGDPIQGGGIVHDGANWTTWRRPCVRRKLLIALAALATALATAIPAGAGPVDITPRLTTPKPPTWW